MTKSTCQKDAGIDLKSLQCGYTSVIPATWEAVAGGLQVKDQSVLHSEDLFQKINKQKNNKRIKLKEKKSSVNPERQGRK
jgi:hypothetical protein